MIPQCQKHPQSLDWVRNGAVCCAICGSVKGPPYPPEPPIEYPVIRSFAVYSRHAARTEGDFPIVYFTEGACGEAGEISGKVRKIYYHGHDIPLALITEEIGDALWFLDRTAAKLGTTLAACAEQNIAKLMDRYPNGYDPERSRKRKA